MNLKSITKLAAIVSVLAVASSARAVSVTSVTYDITSDHATGGLGTAPFGTVNLTQNGTKVDFTVHLVTGYSFVTTGAADNQYFKFNGSGVSVSDIVFGTAGMKANTGNLDGDGTGHFVFGIGPNPLNNGINKYTGDLNFSVKNATISDLNQPNALGIIFVADLIAPNGNTGPADVSIPSVPDGGATIALLGVGLLGLGALRRKI